MPLERIARWYRAGCPTFATRLIVAKVGRSATASNVHPYTFSESAPAMPRPILRTPERHTTTRARSSLTFVYALLCLLFLSASSLAQGRGGGGPGGGGPGGGRPGGGGPGGMGGGMHEPGGFERPSMSPPPGSNGPTESTMRGGLQLGPPGRWWDDNHFARSIGLEAGQQQRMDAVFSANKGTLVTLYKNLQHEESQLEKTVRAKELNEAEIFQQIDRVTQARGELEKANAHMLLQLRKEMTPEQAARLEEHRGAQ